jgi:hypothetical protein
MIWYNKEENKKIRFIHIPRTAGRSLINCLLHCGYSPYEDLRGYYVGQELYHLPYEKEIELFPETVPEITIIRNPVEKFISAGKGLGLEFPEDYPSFKHEMKNKPARLTSPSLEGDITMHSMGYINWPNNWFTKQSKYVVNPETNVWRFEDGFGMPFVEWFYEKFQITINSEHLHPVKKDYYDDVTGNHYSAKVIDNIERYYHDDIELLGY